MVDLAQPELKVEDSLKKRYLYKLLTNFVGFSITLITASIIPRGLGPVAYGNFSFLTAFFTQIVTFFTAGTSHAFYNKLSQRLQETGLIKFYWGFVGIASLSVVSFVAIAFMLGIEEWFWPGQAEFYIWLAVGWGLLTWCSRIINQIVDAYGLTVHSEMVRMQQRFIWLGLVLLMFWLDWFSLTNFFLAHYFIILFLCFSWWRVLTRVKLFLFPKAKQSFFQIKGYIREFYDYAAPLIIYSLISLLVVLFDRWLLQHFAGSIEQGFYSLSYKIGAICFLFTSAMIPLLTREFAIAFSQQNLGRMSTLFRRYTPILYMVAAYLAVFVAIQADKVSYIFGGSDFRGATIAIAIMAFYPIHQTYGQFTGSFFLATGQTKLFRNIGVFPILFSVPLTYWLIAPENRMGLDLGATGLAIKMVGFQFLTVNLYLWFSVRSLRLSFLKFFSHQIYTVILLVGIAWVTKVFIDHFIQNVILAFLVSGLIYSVGFVTLIIIFPGIILMSRSELTEQLSEARWLQDYIKPNDKNVNE